MAECRKKDLKKTITSEDGRRRRGDTVLQLRKSKKEEGITKRRNVNLVGDNFTLGPLNASTVTTSNQSYTIFGDGQKVPSLQDIPFLVQSIQSLESSKQLVALRGFRRLLSSEKNPPVQECVDCGVMPIFVAMLQRCDNYELQFEAAWALTNIASTDRTILIMEYGAIPHLIALLLSPNHDVREQSAWCLGNVAGDGPNLRDHAIKNGAILPIVSNINQPANISLLRNCTWSLSNFCRGKPQPDVDIVRQCLPVLAAIITSCNDPDTIVDAVWALSYVSDGDNNHIQEVIDLNVVPALDKILNSGVQKLIVPALRTLGNIVSGSDNQTQIVVDANILPSLVTLLSCSNKKNIRKETCWMLSNIAAGSRNQLDTLVMTPKLIDNVLLQMSTATEWDVRKEATWVISNVATGGSNEHIALLLKTNVVKYICDLLDVGEVRILLVAMEALEALLRFGFQTEGIKKELVSVVDDSGGIEKLEQLQEHENTEIYSKAIKLLETYFGGSEDDCENLIPIADGNGKFAFGISQKQTNELDTSEYVNRDEEFEFSF